MDEKPKSPLHSVVNWMGETLVEGLLDGEVGGYILIFFLFGLVVFAALYGLYGLHQWLSDPGTTWASIFPGSTDLDVLSIKPESWKL